MGALVGAGDITILKVSEDERTSPFAGVTVCLADSRSRRLSDASAQFVLGSCCGLFDPAPLLERSHDPLLTLSCRSVEKQRIVSMLCGTHERQAQAVDPGGGR